MKMWMFIMAEDDDASAASEAGDDSNDVQNIDNFCEFVDPNEEEFEAGDNDEDELLCQKPRHAQVNEDLCKSANYKIFWRMIWQ